MLSTKPCRNEAAILYIAAVFFCFCLGALLIGALQQFDLPGFQKTGGLGTVMVATLSFQGAACVLALVFLRLHQVKLADGLGLSGPRAFRAIGLGALACVVSLPVVWWLQGTSVAILTNLGWPPKTQLALTLLAGTDSLWLRAYLGLFAVGIAPVAEEFIFRGLLYPVIKQAGYPRLALAGVSLLFAVIHVEPALLPPLFVLALVLTWLYETTDNLLAPITAHAVFNGANLLMLTLQQLDMLPSPK